MIIFISMLSKKFMLIVFYKITDLLIVVLPDVAHSPLQTLLFFSSLQGEMFSGFAHYYVYAGIIILTAFMYNSFRVSGHTWSDNLKNIYAMACYGILFISFTSHVIIFHNSSILFILMIFIIFTSFVKMSNQVKIFGLLLCALSYIIVLTRRSMFDFSLYAFYS